ncbi:4957_t:CDS:2, partial [Dentiscutata heterogama]
MEEEEEQPPTSTSQPQQSQESQQSQPQSQDITIPQTGPGGREIVAAHEPTHPSHRETSLLSGGIGSIRGPYQYAPYPPYTMETQQDTRVNVGDSSNIYGTGYDNLLMGPPHNRGARPRRLQDRSFSRGIFMKFLWALTALANLGIVIGCGFLVYYYINSSIQSIYEIIAKYVIILYLVLEGVFRLVNAFQIHDFTEGRFRLHEGILVLLCYLLFGRVQLTDSQIIKLANAADSTCFIIMTLFAMHLWLIEKESNPIFSTERRSRRIEVYLAVPIIYITFMRIWLYKADPVPTVQPQEETPLATATGGHRLGVRVENYETYYRMEKNTYCDKCVYGCCMLCDKCCASTYSICCSCYEWDYVPCDCGICDCNGAIASCCGGFFNALY